MLFERGFIASAPAAELRNLNITGSLFGFNTLLVGAISEPLRNAVSLLCEHCGDRPFKFIARPEIFTHGPTLDWLASRSDGAEDHIAITDGSTIRPIPGMRTHIFFYSLGSVEHSAALAKMEKRVPEIFTRVHSQINTALKFRWKQSDITPPTLYIERASSAGESDATLTPLFLNRYSAEESARRMALDEVTERSASHFPELVYVPLTTTALADQDFMKALAALTARSVFNPGTSLLLGAPDLPGPSPTRLERLKCLVGGLLLGDCRIPPMLCANIFVAMEDVSASGLCALADKRHLIVHDSYDFWRRAPAFYNLFDRTTVYGRRRRHDANVYRQLLVEAYGSHVELILSPLNFSQSREPFSH